MSTPALSLGYRPEADLVPEIIAMAVPPFIAKGVRAATLFQIKRVGAVYFVENRRERRSVDAAGKEVITDNWTGVAIAKGKDARKEAFEFMQEANAEVIKLSRASPRGMGE